MVGYRVGRNQLAPSTPRGSHVAEGPSVALRAPRRGAAPDAEGDDLPVEMAAFEKIIHAQHLRFALSKGEFAADMPRFSRLHQSRSGVILAARTLPPFFPKCDRILRYVYLLFDLARGDTMTWTALPMTSDGRFSSLGPFGIKIRLFRRSRA